MPSRKRTHSFNSTSHTSNESSPISVSHRDYYEGDFAKMMKEGKKMKVGYTVAYVPSNQMGYQRYQVHTKKGKKDLKLIADYEGSVHQSRSPESSLESNDSHESKSSMQSRGSLRGGKNNENREKTE